MILCHDWSELEAAFEMDFGRPPTRGMNSALQPGSGLQPSANGPPPPTGQLRGPGMYQGGVSLAQPFAPPGTGMRPPATGMRLGTGMQPPGTGMRLGTGMRPPSGQAPPGTGVGLVTPLNIDNRPVTQQGVAAARVKTGQATAGPGSCTTHRMALISWLAGRQVADKTYYLNILRNKTQDISKGDPQPTAGWLLTLELQSLTNSKKKLKPSSVREWISCICSAGWKSLKRRCRRGRVHLRYFGTVRAKLIERQDYNFASKLMGREMDDLEGESKRRCDVPTAVQSHSFAVLRSSTMRRRKLIRSSRIVRPRSK